MKHLKTINELFKTPILNQNDIQQMIEYLEDYAEKNGYEVYRFPEMDMGKLMPNTTRRIVSKEDPWGEEEWEDDKPVIMSNGFKLFDGEDAVLSFQYVRNGNKYFNELWIDDSDFRNIDFEMLKKLIEI